MNSIILIGATGRMSQTLQNCCKEKGIAYKIHGSKNLISSFANAQGIIDFSLPSVSKEICGKALEARIPFVCGTTGWASSEEREKIFEKAAREIPMVWDSNFSEGIELLCQMGELLTHKIPVSIAITDIHHQYKKDAPSGTALKLAERLSHTATKTLQSIRLGEIPGEHRVLTSWNDETIELVHRVYSRRPFAEGALRAFKWAIQQKPGLYSMKDVLKGKIET